MNIMPKQPMDILNFSICGFHQYCFEAPVHLYFASQNLCGLLETTQDNLACPDADGYLPYVHPEDRAGYEEFLQKAMAEPCTRTLQYRLVSRSGNVVSVSDTLTTRRLEDNTLVGDSVLMELAGLKRPSVYLAALADVYDKIFQYNFTERTVTCLHCRENSRFHWVQNIPMAMESATEKWITDTVVEEDRPRLKAFFQDYFAHGRFQQGSRPTPITYSARSFSGMICQYRGLFLTMGPNTQLFCCRCLQESDLYTRQNHEKMEQLLRSFTEGIAAFEVTDGFVTPLYASDNVCRFFGYSNEAWLDLMEKKTSLAEFVAHSEADLATFEALLQNGSGEFSYLDLQTDTRRQMKAVCSAPSSNGTRFVMLYHGAATQPTEVPKVFLRTFGYFEVFVGEKPIPFRHQKSKELLALLIDRKGGFLSSQEAIGFLWEDEAVNSVTLARYRKVALRLKTTLEAYGIEDILECVDGKRRIIPSKVRCDLYEYLSDPSTYGHLFKGSYLSNYSWSEYTLAELTSDIVLA